MKFKKWTFIGIFFILGFSVLLYFANDFLKHHQLLDLITPQNNSIWEYLKLTFYALLLYGVIEYAVLSKENRNYLFTKALTIILALFFVVVFFYGYTSFMDQNVYVNLIVYVLAITLAQLFSYVLFNYKLYVTGFNYVAFLAIIIGVLVFSSYSYFPGTSQLFKDLINLKFN